MSANSHELSESASRPYRVRSRRFDPAEQSHSRLLYGLPLEPPEVELEKCVGEPSLLFESKSQCALWFIAYVYHNVYNWTCRYNLNADNDLFQECYLRLYQSFSRSGSCFKRERASPKEFLKGVIHKKFLESCLKEKRSRMIGGRTVVSWSENLEVPCPADADDDKTGELRVAISHLPDSDQELLRPLLAEQTTIAEFAQQKGKTKNAIYMQLFALRNRLRAALERED